MYDSLKTVPKSILKNNPKNAPKNEFAEKYLQKGMKIGVSGHLQSSSYPKDGETVYTMDVVVAEHEFCEKRNSDGCQATA